MNNSVIVLRKIKGLIKKPSLMFNVLGNRGFFNWMDDKTYLKILFKVKMNSKLDLDNPKTFNEKLQWLKLYDRNPSYCKMVDKYEAKKYVSSIIGEQYIIKTLGVWDKFEDINFDDLPQSFVIKCTHDSGGVVICSDKKSFDYKSAKRKLNKSLKRNFYWSQREWPYKNVSRRIICEEFLRDSKHDVLTDYKFYCFDGIPRVVMINSDRGSKTTKADYFDMDYNLLDFTWGYPHADKIPDKPINFELMKDLAKKLSQNLKHIRIDFYEVNGKVYFGELTFYDGSGFQPIIPKEWDYKLGGFISVP